MVARVGKTPEQAAQDRREEARLVGQINEMTKRVPASQNGWSYQRAVDFKNAVGAAISETKKARKKIDSLRAAANQLAVFYN